jgi:hypothetical protein
VAFSEPRAQASGFFEFCKCLLSLRRAEASELLMSWNLQ